MSISTKPISSTWTQTPSLKLQANPTHYGQINSTRYRHALYRHALRPVKRVTLWPACVLESRQQARGLNGEEEAGEGGSRREEAQASAAGEGAAARGCCRRGCCRRWRCLAETMTPKSTLWDNMAPEAFGVAYQKSLGLALGSSQLRQGQNESVSVSQG